MKLNLRNPQVTDYLFSCIAKWVEEFDIDGLRLDVAYCLDGEFLKALRRFCGGLKSDFFLYGEILGGDYRRILNGEMLPPAPLRVLQGPLVQLQRQESFEINHSLNRMFSDDPYAPLPGQPPLLPSRTTTT